MKIRFALLFPVLVSVGTAWAIGVSSGKNLASTILTEGLAAQILNTEVEAGSANVRPDITFGKMVISNCAYNAHSAAKFGDSSPSPTKSSRSAGHIELTIRQSERPEDAKAQFESAKVIFRGKDVSGIGDAAFRPTTLAQLHVLKGRFYIIVTAGTFKADPGLEENAASEILRRLRD